jgi:TIR domain
VTEVHGKVDGAASDQGLKVFISYSRADIGFADELVDGLELTGFETTIDRHSIIEGEDWKARIGALISGADTVVFIISPDSVKSEICTWEAEEAHRRSKRILPVLCRPIGAQSVPSRLSALNYVRFDDGRSFVSGLRALVRALRTDVDWLREHTRLLARAMEWEAAGHQANRMLVGADIVEAKAWAANRPKDAPAPTDLHLAFIRASEQAEADRTNAERQRLEQMKAAQTERAEALAGREVAVRKLSRRTTIGLFTSGTLTAAAAGLAYWGVDAERRFRIQRQRAADAEKYSLEASVRKEAMRTDIVGQFAAYAASPNQFGSEGPKGGNSPYTAELLLRLSNRSVSLYEACFTGHLNVQRNSSTGQRPFLSTDMNGDIYLMQQPESRTRKAIVVSVDRLYRKGDLYNAKNDAVAWETFLKAQCQFDVLRLENPDSQTFLAAIADISLGPAKKQGSTGSPLLHKAGFKSIEEPEANTLVMFVFAGFGAYKSGANYLMTDDSDINNIETLPQSMVPLIKIQDTMRQVAAASILILDSNFPDLDKIQAVPR